MFQTSSCYRKLPTHSQCHAEFLTNFPFLFPFTPFLIFFLKVYSTVTVKTIFLYCPSHSLPLLEFGVCLLPMNFDCLFVPYFLVLLINCYIRLSCLLCLEGLRERDRRGVPTQDSIILSFKMFKS